MTEPPEEWLLCVGGPCGGNVVCVPAGVEPASWVIHHSCDPLPCTDRDRVWTTRVVYHRQVWKTLGDQTVTILAYHGLDASDVFKLLLDEYAQTNGVKRQCQQS
jgi:hypothetical protein